MSAQLKPVISQPDGAEQSSHPENRMTQPPQRPPQSFDAVSPTPPATTIVTTTATNNFVSVCRIAFTPSFIKRLCASRVAALGEPEVSGRFNVASRK
jgi:hypothetical protein